MALALHEAARHGDVAAVNTLIATQGVDVNTIVNGATVIYTAIVNGRSEVAKVLLQAKADPNLTHPGRTLSVAAWHGWDMIVRLLMENNVNVNVIDFDGHSALDYAIARGKASCVDILLRAGANPNIRDLTGMCPLERVTKNLNGEKITKLLIEASADINMLQQKNTYIPKWKKDLFDQRRDVKRAVATFLGVMKYRFRLECEATQIIGYRYPRDMTRKIAVDIWNTRMDARWHPIVMKRVKACNHKCGNKEACRHLCCKK